MENPTKNVPLREGIWGSPCKPKKFELSSSVGYHPHQKLESPCLLITDHVLEKKVSLIDFGQSFSKILPQACIFSNTIMPYLKKLIGTKSLNTKQCPAGLSPGIIPHYSPRTLMGNPRGWGRIPPNSQKFTHFPHQKNSP